MDELQICYDEFEIILNEEGERNDMILNNQEIQMNFNIFYQNLPIAVQTFIKEFYYPRKFESKYLKLLFKGIHIISKELANQNKEIVEILKQEQFTSAYDDMITKLMTISMEDKYDVFNEFIEMGISVYTQIEFDHVPMEMFHLQFQYLKEMELINKLFFHFIKLLTDKIVFQMIKDSKARNIRFEEVLFQTIRNLDNVQPSDIVLETFQIYLHFISKSCRYDVYFLNIHLQSLFFNKMLKILSQCTPENVTPQNKNASSIIALLQHLCFYGDGVESLLVIKFNKTHPTGQSVNIIRNTEIPSILVKLLECRMFTMPVLQSLKIVLFSNASNFTLLPGYIESICLMIVVFDQEEIDYVFGMLEYLFINLQVDPTNYLKILLAVINFDVLIDPKFLSPFVGFMTRLIGSNMSYYQLHFQPFLKTFINCLLQAFEYFEEENEITRTFVKMLKALIMDNKENVEYLMLLEGLFDRIVLQYLRKPNHRFSVVTLLIPFLVQVTENQVTSILTPFYHDILHDIDPISRLKSISLLMDKSSTAQELFSLCDNFELFHKFIELWDSEDEQADEDPSEKVLHQRLAILNSCVDCYISALKGRPENKDYLLSSLSIEFLEEFVLYNPWKETEFRNIVIILISLLIEEPIRKSETLLTEEQSNIVISNYYVFPALFRLIDSLDIKEQIIFIKNITKMMDNTYSVYGLYQMNIFEMIIDHKGNEQTNELYMKLMEKIGAYSINYNSCRKLFQQMNEEPFNSRLLSSLSYMSSGTMIGGYTFDTSEKISYIKSHVWLDKFPFSLCGWFKFDVGYYNILELTSTHAVNGIKITLQNKFITVFIEGEECLSSKVSFGTWVHFSLTISDKISLYIDGELKDEKLHPMVFQQGSFTICIGNYDLIHSLEGRFSVAEMMIINGKRSLPEIKAMVELGPQYKGKYSSSNYKDVETLSRVNEPASIYIERNEISFILTDLMNENLLSDRIIKGRVCPSSPSPFVSCVIRCGGIALILSLIEKSTTSSELVDSLQILLFCLRNSSQLYNEAFETHSFDILILILHSKVHLMSIGIVQILLTLSGIGTSDDHFTVTHPEILTTLVLDFSLLKSCSTGLEHVLKTLKSVYDYNPIEASKTLHSVSLIRKLMKLFIDETTEQTTLSYICQILTSILSVNYNREEVMCIISFTPYFLDIFEQSEFVNHREWCAKRFVQLITILNKLVPLKGMLPGVTPSFIVKFIDIKNPPPEIIPPLLHLAANLSSLSQQFYDDFSLSYGHLFNIVPLIKNTSKCFVPLFSLLLHMSPDQFDYTDNTMQLKRAINPIYFKILFEIIHNCLICEPHPLGNSNCALIIEILSTLIETQALLRDVIIQNDDILHSLLNIIINIDREMMTTENISREQLNICNEVIKMIGFLSSSAIRDHNNYKKIFISVTIIEPKGEYLKLIINQTINGLTNFSHSITKVRVTECLTEFSHFLLDMLFIQQLNVDFSMIISSIGRLMTFYTQNKELQSVENTKHWVEMVDRMNLMVFDVEDDESLLFAVQQFYVQDFFFEEKLHTENYVAALLCIVLKKIHDDVEIIQDTVDPLLYSCLKKIVMSYQNNVMKILSSRDQRKKFKALLQMCAEEIVEFVNDNMKMIETLIAQLQTNLKIFKDEQNERKIKIIHHIIDGNDSLDKDRGKENKIERQTDFDSLRMISTDIMTKEMDLDQQFSEETKIFLRESWKRMKIKLIMPTGIWEKNIDVYKIDNIEGAFGMRRRIVIDYEFYDKFDINETDIGRELKLLKHRDESSESSSKRTEDISIDMIEIEENGRERFDCKHINGLEEIDGMLIIDENGLQLIHRINERINYSKGKYSLIRLEWCEIASIVKRRYLFENNSIEIFSTFGKSLFLVFKKRYPKMIRRINKFFSRGVQNINTIEVFSSLPFMNKIGKVFTQNEDVTESWRKGEMSNFAYLMWLNLRAGRSQNDLSQYPIFPWVLTNFTSEHIDLDDIKNYRNMAYPVVAQTEQKRERLHMKYEECGSHYGNHYSSLATTLIYLFRCEPYSKMHMELFDGHFDTDRLLVSISNLFDNLSATPIELIPEFFYLSQFLVNFNRLDFGKRRDGMIVNDIELPPWCHGNPRVFVDMNMKALESAYASEHLNEWIDLIFGYKQRGKPAEEACNVFPESSYESSDIGKMNEREKETLKIKIQNFGQTPLQLFKTPHPRREVGRTLYSIGIFEENHCNTLTIANKSGFPVGEIRMTEKNEIKISRKGECYLSNGIIKMVGNDVIKIERNGKIHCIEECQSGNVLETNDKIIVIGGSDGTLEIIDIMDEIPKKRGRLCGHTAEVKCCVIGTKSNIIITCDINGKCIIWDVRSLVCLHVLEINESIIDITINDETGDFVLLRKNAFSFHDINGDVIGESEVMKEYTFNTVCISQTPIWCFERFIVTGDSNGTLMYWKVNDDYTFTIINCLTTYPTRIDVLTLNDSNTHLLIGFANGIVICLN